MAHKADFAKRLTADDVKAATAKEAKLFFNQAFGGGGGGGLGGSPSAFTSPGMNPQMLAALLAMGGAPGAMSPSLPAPPGNAAGQNATPSGFPAPPQIPPSNIMQMLQGLGGNPQMMQRILAMLGGGQGNALGAATGGVTGNTMGGGFAPTV